MPADPTSLDEDVLDTPVEVEPAPPSQGAEPEAIAEPPDPIEVLKAALAKAEQEKKENWERYLRSAADLENYRRRAKRDLDDARADSKTRVLKEMLPVVDNLERALLHAEESIQAPELTAMIDGIRLVLRQFTAAFERCDVTAVDALGKPFDPNVHEAISQAETSAQPAGTVMSVLQRGYKLGDRLLRPALVVVAKAPSAPPAPEPEPEPEAPAS
jgi:molecular chaperone GrpE